MNTQLRIESYLNKIKDETKPEKDKQSLINKIVEKEFNRSIDFIGVHQFVKAVRFEVKKHNMIHPSKKIGLPTESYIFREFRRLKESGKINYRYDHKEKVYYKLI